MMTTVVVPDLGKTVEDVEVISVLVAVGDSVAKEQGIIEVETEKATVEVPCSIAGTVTEIHVSVGDRLGTGDAIISVEAAEVAVAEAAPVESPAAPVAQPEPEPEPARETPKPTSSEHLAPTWTAAAGPPKLVPAAPRVRRFAREVGVDITQVRGSGPGGRLSIEDVKEYAKHLLKDGLASATSLRQPELPDFSAWGEVSEEEMSKVRRLTAEGMTRAWTTIPQVTNHDLADVTDLEKLRKSFKARVEQAGGKLTMTAILVKVVASALKVFPDLNASVDMERRMIVRKHFVHVGVAVDTERGLLVPVVRDADRKNITQIAGELNDLAKRARERKLKPDEMGGATFTISNLGGIGGTGFSPIINWPEVGILGVSRGRWQPEWNGSEFVPRMMLPLSLTYDHRLVDGAVAARFLKWLTEAIEHPLLMALEG